MTALRAEALSLIEEIPDEKIEKLLNIIKNFIKTEDPFWSEENQQHLKKVIDDMNHGRNIVEHELIEVD